MRRGCISLGNVKCDICSNVIAYPERYLVVDEENGKESDNGTPVRYCVKCALDKGYAHYKKEKGEQILTFLPEPEVGQL
ncbi:MAG: hypothetical protein PHY25_02285 [Dehalococcoidales bacterium]|jgi:hypothetical protein|nr:hypothetical protein [Dehalococcoidales bacterium]MDD4465497.1 hypothetical protein [Dehalococcoidales bacterium]MDD5402855.1 hypothetical protein [Dehalococcoidales bacterium]